MIRAFGAHCQLLTPRVATSSVHAIQALTPEGLLIGPDREYSATLTWRNPLRCPVASGAKA
jgi:hypothetical protein